MKKVFLLVVAVVLVAAGFFGWKFLKQGVSIDITQQQIQQQIDPKFPVQKSFLVVSTTVSDPKVMLKEDSDRVFIGANVTVTVPTQPKATGSTVLSGKVNFDREQGVFFLDDFKVEELKIAGVADQHVKQAEGVVSLIGKEVLHRYPIYKLDPNERAGKLAKAFLKSVDVVGGKLRVTLGVGS